MRRLRAATRILVQRSLLLTACGFLAHVGTADRLDGHEPGALYVAPIPWTLPRVAHSYVFSYPELGSGAFRTELTMRSVADRVCAVGGAIGLDIDDDYAFDVDETVTLTLTYAPAYSGPFTVFWDANGGEGVGQQEVEVQPGQALRQVTVRLERARLAGQGSRGIDIAVSGRGGVALCNVEVTRSGTTARSGASGRVRLLVRDADTGRPIPARVGLYDSTGRLPLPGEQAVVVSRFGDPVRRLRVNQNAHWPSENRQAFYVNGRYEADVPAGVYEVVVARGIEYEPYRGEVQIAPGQTGEVYVELERYADLADRGWYSFDGHVHVGRDTVEDGAAWAFGAAEDVRMLNLTQMGNLSRTYFSQPGWGAEGRFEQDGYVILSNQEDPRTVQHGHTLHYNLTAPIHLPSEDYYSYHDAFEQVSLQGGLSGYAHHGQLFNGRRGLALDVPFGIVDFIEVLQNGRLATEPWYDFLNLGYRILPMAGSDFPYMDLPGVVRAYAKIDGAFTADAWFEAYGRGNVYVTNGPFLEFTVNGQPMGSEVRVTRGGRLSVVAEVELNPAVDALDRIELVVFGEVVASEAANGRDRVSLRTEITADQSQWLAVRAYGATQDNRGVGTAAHSAATFVVVGDDPVVKREGLSALVELQRTRLREFMTEPIDARGDLEPWETFDLMGPEWERQQELLRSRVEEADARYQEFLERAPVAMLTRAAGPFEFQGVRGIAGVALVALLILVALVRRGTDARSTGGQYLGRE